MSFEEEEFKKWEKKIDKYTKYTWEELDAFRKKGIEGQVCMCTFHIANTMTIECVICGKVQEAYAKNYIKTRP